MGIQLAVGSGVGAEASSLTGETRVFQKREREGQGETKRLKSEEENRARTQVGTVSEEQSPRNKEGERNSEGGWTSRTQVRRKDSGRWGAGEAGS